MSKLEDVILEVRADLSYEIPSREDFLARCAIQKIQDRSDNYNRQLDSFLQRIEESEMYGRSLARTASSLKSLSKLITVSYDNLIKMVSQYEKNIFHRKD